MQEKNIFKKGDIYRCDFGENIDSIINGIRPVLIVQADKTNTNCPTIIVAAISSVNKKETMSSQVALGKNFGLVMPSMVMLEQIRSVNKNRIGKYIGHIDDKNVLKQINNGILKTFGLLNYNNRRSNIYCLCSKCLKYYFDNDSYIIRRVDPYKKEKNLCDKCKEYGYDYYVTYKSILTGG